MILRFIKKLVDMDIPAEYKESFNLEISRIQAFRAKVVAYAFVLIQLMVILIFIPTRRNRLTDYPSNVYLALYIFYCASMVIWFLVFRNLEKNVEKNQRKILIVGAIFTFYTLEWCSVISILDQLSSGQVTVYIAAIISIALATLLKPFILLFIYSSVHLIFIIVLPHFQKSPDLIFSNLINTTTIILIAWTVDIILYHGKKNDFINKMIIEQKNRELQVLNEKLLKTNEELQRLSVTDALTGLYNRRKFDEQLYNQWKICRRFSVPVSIIMIDIDFFKQFNDLYGHIAGDRCLAAIADTLKRMVKRPTDCLARFGGEEFIISVSHLNAKESFSYAESIRKAVENLKIPHGNSSISPYVTISIGISTVIPNNQSTAGMLTHAADCALYRAKESGRNKTELLEKI